MEDALAADNIPVRRFDFPYRKSAGSKRRPPDRQPVLIQAIIDEVAAWANDGIDPSRLVLGGRSMGGRMCSIANSEGLDAAGLLLLSYPLHPPGKPDNLRIDHFGSITAPCLFVSGERDPFGTPDEFVAHVADIRAPVTTCWLSAPGAGHDPSPAHDIEIVTAAREWILGLQD